MFTCKIAIVPKHVLNGLQRLSISSMAITAAAATQTAPKRLPKGYNGPTAYGLFTKQENVANVPITEQAKQIAQKWNALSPEEKQKFKEQSEQIAHERAAEFAKLNKAAKSGLIEENAVKKEKLIKHRIKMASKQYKLDTKHPIRPLHPYVQYYKQEIGKVEKVSKKNIGEHAAAIGNSWKQLSDAEKKPLVDAYEAEIKKYRVDLARWTKTYGAEYKKIRASFRPKPKKVATAKKAKPSAPGKKRGRKGGLYKRLTSRKTASAPKKAAAAKE
uniref:HMG box domain-containing protein n=1 Tax=Panagrellus redivivus TaxID=6233 RepID=A0A7E4VZS6_PANRE